MHADSLQEVAGDLRCLITSSCLCYKDILHANKLLEQTISPLYKIPYSHDKLVTMLNLVEGINCSILSDLLI